jgi:ElaB/YqjD/DUF883 family membrane-anchored ribosome-binding protein
MNAEGKRTAEDIEAEINHVRARMDATLEEIEHRLTPRELIREGMNSLSRIEASRYVFQLADLVRRYPVPAVVAGISLAGLLVARQRYSGSRSPDDAASAGRLSRAIDAAKETLRDTKETISETAGTARAKLAGATSSGIERASDIASDARRQLRQASSSAQSMARERPLAVGAAALAIGAAVAFCIPYIRRKWY